MQPAERPIPRAGDTVAGKYRLVRPIGLGAMGLIFEATHLRMRQNVAIKFLQPNLVSQPGAVARFEREGRAASGLTSPHATRILDVDTTPEGVPYIVSELLEGRDLRHELEERIKLPIAEAATYIVQVCAVMAEAHALGIVHRDLKPSNVFLARIGGTRVAKVLDFGISKMDEDLDLTRTGVMVGSPRYMSPEQVQAKNVDRRSDIWSLGVLLFRSISGTYPFEGTSTISIGVAILTQTPRDLREVVPGAPAALASVIEKALERAIEARFETVRDFAEAVAPFGTPECAALARSLTREVGAAMSDRRGHPMDVARADRALVETKAGPDRAADIPIEVSLEPPEQATKGTWTQATGPDSIRTSRSRRRSAGAMAAVALLLAVGAVVLARMGRGVHGGHAGEPPRVAAAVTAEMPAAIMAPPPAASEVPTAPSAQPATLDAPAVRTAAKRLPAPVKPQTHAPAAAPPPEAQQPPRNPTHL
jgi:serine/threonine protein kinase